MKKNIVVLLVICAVFMTSCTTRTYEEISESESSNSPTYTANIEPVIRVCVNCHATGRRFPTLETYEQVRDAAQNGDLICRIDQTQSCGSVMPPGDPLPRTTIDMIILWQKEGYKN